MSVFTFEDLNSGVSLDDDQVRSLCSTLFYGSSVVGAASLLAEVSPMFVLASAFFGFGRLFAAVPGVRKKRVPGRFWLGLSLFCVVLGVCLLLSGSLVLFLF